jgi:hypothetical protein
MVLAYSQARQDSELFGGVPVEKHAPDAAPDARSMRPVSSPVLQLLFRRWVRLVDSDRTRPVVV